MSTTPPPIRPPEPPHEAQVALAQALGRGDFERVANAASEWTQRHPQAAIGWKFLGAALDHLGHWREGAQAMQRAVDLAPNDAEAWGNLGKLRKDLGELDAAWAAYEHALTLKPDDWLNQQRRLYVLNHLDGVPPQRRQAAGRQFGACLQSQCPARFKHAPRAPHQPLRVGLVSADLRYHPVGFFLQHVLQALRHQAVAIHLYDNTAQRDAMTQRLADAIHGRGAWVDIRHLDDRAAAERIAQDDLDVLLDLSGHTAGNRLAVFAQRPTRLQGSWLGYFGTTGVATMDFVLSDAVSTPTGDETAFTEALVRLPHTRLCYGHDDLALAPAVNPLPALTRGHMTVGCFQNLSKLSPVVLALWGDLLRASPDTRMRLQSKQLRSAEERAQWRQRLIDAGWPADRVDLHAPGHLRDYFAALAQVDVIWDSFPFPGGTTTCEALWMGVPTLSLRGHSMVARQGASLLHAAGLSDWVCENLEQYREQALHWLNQAPALAALRLNLRAQVTQSPLFDAAAFARDWTQTLQRLAHQAAA